MKHSRRIYFRYLLLFALCLTLFLFFSCSKTETKTAVPAPEEGTPAKILSNIFSETACELPENARVYSNVLPYYERETGTITEFLLEREETVDADGVIGETLTGWLYTITADGDLLGKEQLPLPEDFTYLNSGIVLPEAVIFVCTSRADGVTVYRLDRATLETTSSGKIGDLIQIKNFSLSFCAADSGGRFYGTDQNTVFVLNPDLTLAFTCQFPATIYTMSRGADGAVWVTFNAGMESCAAKIDPETKKLGTYYTFTRGMDSANTPLHYLLNASMNTGDSAYNFFYYDMNSAIWGASISEDGSLTETQVFDLFNSGISKLHMTFSGEAGLFPMCFLTDDLFLTWKHNGEGWSGRHDSVILHHRAEDIDMSDQSVITIAYAYPLNAATVEHITEFKRTRPNLSIVLEDYSKYSTTENTRAGEEKLCFDLVNGFIKPDIVITDASINTLSDNMVMTQLYRNNLYVDLVPYLEKDDTLNFDNLFGCIRRLFADGKGGMWGISTDVEVSVLLGSAKLLGDYTEKGYWSLGELLDFFDSLPADTEKYYGHNGRQVKWGLLAQGYGYFMENGSCSFDSEEFVRYLSYLQSVPATPEEWRQTSPVAEIRNLSFSQQEEALSDALAIGKIALDGYSFSYRDLHNLLFSDETFPIGYATKNDSGFRVKADTTYVLTTFAEDPDLCFDLVKSFFVCEVKYVGAYSFRWPLFARKDHFETALIDQTTPTETQLMSDEEYRAYCAERGIPYSNRAAAPIPLTDEERAAVYELFDRIGSPIMEETPEAVADIVDEEISAFLSGMGTAEDCAAKIQSRVEIWLAEHE